MEASLVNIHADLIRRCGLGEPHAQYDLYRLYNKAMFNTALRICGNREEAEDVLQEAFLSAFHNIHHYRGDASFGAWLKRIVINKAITAIRKQEKEQLMREEVESEEQEDLSMNLDLNVARIKQALGQLAPGFRSVLSLYLFEGYDHKEIAEIMGITESTSKSQYKRAKDQLKKVLEKEVKYG